MFYDIEQKCGEMHLPGLIFTDDVKVPVSRSGYSQLKKLFDVLTLRNKERFRSEVQKTKHRRAGRTWRWICKISCS